MIDVSIPGLAVLPSQPPRLLAPGYNHPSLQSSDGGTTWTPWLVGAQTIRRVHPNATAASFLFATTEDRALHRSDDGGHTWTRALPPPDLARYETVIEYVLPVGPQPGLVYGLSGYCRPSGFTGCWWTPRDVVRSRDGGVTWTSLLRTGAGAGPPPLIATGPVATQLAVSPADPARLLMLTRTEVFRSRDHGDTWESAAPMLAIGGELVADPADANRWYALFGSGLLHRSDDFASSWTTTTIPSSSDGFVELLIDPRAPSRLYAVTMDGAVSMSDDRGGLWQPLAQPSTFARVTEARLAPVAGNAIYAASTRGILKFGVRDPGLPSPIPLVEYHRPDADRYFMTSNPEEIAKLDAAGGPFIRTGQAFGVWPASAIDDDAASVCRFYGRPEAQLDSHFFTASPTECEQVIARFPQSWLLESPRVFAMALPDGLGRCRPDTLPVYRLYNNRRDVNHRYTISAAVRDAMRAAGWLPEGYGPDAVAMCSPR
jgi:photosystem II stability/assembly factor-like uncharacterized protein